ncbi:MAG: hypothetical protein GC179_15025 [Anaerolineaceae bacterium]|nr:hypothetical protein [Anaerolineaceae bacterium]
MRRVTCFIISTVLLMLSCTATLAQDSPAPFGNLDVITAQNANRITEITSLGVGMYGIPFWSDEQTFYFPSTAGIWKYSMSDLQHPVKLAESDAPSYPPLPNSLFQSQEIRSPTPMTESTDHRYKVSAAPGDFGGTIYLFIKDTQTNRTIKQLTADELRLRTYSGIIFRPQFVGHTLFYIYKSTLYRWRPEMNEEALIQSAGDLAFSPNGHFVIDFTLTATADSPISFKVYRLDSAPATMIYNPNYAGTDRWQSLAFSPDGLHVATGGNNGNVRIWDVPSDGSRYFDIGKPKEFNETQVVDLAYSHDGHYIGGVVTTVSGSYAFLLDAQTHAEVARINGRSYNGVTFFGSIGFHPMENVVAFGGADGTIRLWDISDLIAKKSIEVDTAWRVLHAHTDMVTAIVFSEDGNKIASASWDTTVRIWDYQTGKNSLTLNAHSDQVWTVAFNPQATLLASAGDDGAVKLWNLDTQKDVTLSQVVKKNLYSSLRMSDLAFNRDGTVLATTRINGDISLFNVATHQQITTFNGGDTIWHIAFNRAGTLLASASAGDTSVRIWGIPQQ